MADAKTPTPKSTNPKIVLESKAELAKRAGLPAVPVAPTALAIALTPKHLAAAIAFRDKAASTVISNQATDEGALMTIKDGKDLRRKIVTDWDVPKRKLNELLGIVRNLERAELEAVDAGLKPVIDRHVAWKEADDARIAREEAAEREKREAAERRKREADLQRQEDEAAELEAASDNLSARELWFVTKVVEGDIDWARGAQGDHTRMRAICKDAGYADPVKAVDRLLGLSKVTSAIASSVAAKAIREQAAALREQPITVTTTKVEPKTAKVSGLRHTTNYTCEGVFDLPRFIEAYRANELPDEAMAPSSTHLNKAADQLKDKFEQSYPGARLKITKGVAG